MNESLSTKSVEHPTHNNTNCFKRGTFWVAKNLHDGYM